jgi:hypothetical protein
MKTKVLILALIVSCFAIAAHALDLAGSWDGVIHGPDGDFKLTYVFTKTGDKLTGVAKSEWGDWPMSDLKVENEVVSFHVDTDNGSFPTKGTIKDGVLTVTATGPQGDITIDFKRTPPNVAGRWRAKVQGPDGDMDLVFTFRVDGEKLSGTVASSMGETPFSNGKIDGDKIAFDTEFQGMKIAHAGKIDGDTITVQAKSEAFDVPMTLKRDTTPAK